MRYGQAHHSITSFDLDTPPHKECVTQSVWQEGLLPKQDKPYLIEYDPKGILSFYFFEKHHQTKTKYLKTLFICFLLNADKTKYIAIKGNDVHFFWTCMNSETGAIKPRKCYVDDDLKDSTSIPGRLKEELEKKKNASDPNNTYSTRESIRIEDLNKHTLIGSLAASSAVLATGLIIGFSFAEYTNIIAGTTAATIALIIIVSVSVWAAQKKSRTLTPKKRNRLIQSLHPVHQLNLDTIKREAAESLQQSGIQASTDDLPEERLGF